MPDTPNVGKPASGTYGEGKALDDLKQALPVGAVGNPAPQPAPPPPLNADPVRVIPQREGRPPTAAALPPGVPSVLLGPAELPPMAGPGMAAPGAATPDQSRLALLDQLSSSPDVSAATREWAAHVMDLLLGRA